MSYQGYGGQQGQQQGYGQYNPYAENPYQQQESYGAPQASYGAPQGSYGAPQGRPQAQEQQYEMTSMNGAQSNANDPNRILNECRAVDRAIDEIENDLERLQGLHSRYLADTDTSSRSPLRQEVDRLGESILVKYRGLVARVKTIKQNPESGNPRNAPQVGKIDRRLKTAINQYQQVDRQYRKDSQQQIERQYRIVRPDATEAEVREAVEDTNNQQVFSQALIQSDRRGEAQRVAQSVRGRHADIQKIEQQMVELAQLFQDLEALVVQQEPAVMQIEQKGEQVSEEVGQANVQLDGAVKKARAARKKKWICLGISLTIIIVIIIIVVVVVLVLKH